MDKGSAHFDGGTELPDKAVMVFIQRPAVESLDSVLCNDFIHQTDAIGTGNSLPRLIPQKQVQVMWIESIRVIGQAGAFAYGAKCDLPGDSDLFHDGAET